MTEVDVKEIIPEIVELNLTEKQYRLLNEYYNFFPDIRRRVIKERNNGIIKILGL